MICRLLATRCCIDHAAVEEMAQRVEMADLSVGGFLGMDTHMVVVRYDSLKFTDNKITLPGGTKDGLRMLPAFQYSKK